jgi:hypothetical protein
MIHFPAVACTSSPTQSRALAERAEWTLLRAVRANPGHQQIRRLHIRQPTPLQPEHLSYQTGCAVVVTRSVTVSDQLIRRTCDALTANAARYRSSWLSACATGAPTNNTTPTTAIRANIRKTVRLDPVVSHA